jgi:acyl transferase domain-containing protein
VSAAQEIQLSNRVSYEFDLKGPSFTIKSACSSSLVALHQAVRAIQAGDCNSAIVAGTNLIFSPDFFVGMAAGGVLSPDGSCKTFDASANGYSRAEAINAVYIKRMSDALRDGNPIRAIVRSTASNCDGKSPGGITVPNPEAHESMIRKAYQEANLDPADTAFVEAHGTGTIGSSLSLSSMPKSNADHD